MAVRCERRRRLDARLPDHPPADPSLLPIPRRPPESSAGTDDRVTKKRGCSAPRATPVRPLA